jgi:hypothetical protein
MSSVSSPNEASITRLIGAVLHEQNDEWLLQCRFLLIKGRLWAQKVDRSARCQLPLGSIARLCATRRLGAGRGLAGHMRIRIHNG